ncbi:MAG: hypothetical protein EHM48_02870 [Planctomycetaceae bacterium]|nr:MAG: hypothetical protein EHM48_02870 [Planctomycetaceae bacterium]
MLRTSKFSLYGLGCFAVVLMSAVLIAQGQTSKPASKPASQAAADAIKFDVHNGYFVSNKFEPNAGESFVVIRSQDEFDKVFGIGMVMGDKSHRLPADAFRTNMVLAVVKRGKAMWDFKVDSVTAANGVLTVRYSAVAKPSDSAEFACPFIVSIAKSDYSKVEFVENGKNTKTINLSASTPSSSPAIAPASQPAAHVP